MIQHLEAADISSERVGLEVTAINWGAAGTAGIIEGALVDDLKTPTVIIDDQE